MTSCFEVFEKIRLGTASPVGAGVTRASYSFMETKTLKILEHWADELELMSNYDAAGNLWISIYGTAGVVPLTIGKTVDAGAEPYVLMGSHVDSVANGGNYDGLAGVIAGIEVLSKLKDVRPRPRVRVVALRGEESAWLGAAYKGSKALLGEFASEEIRSEVHLMSGDYHLNRVGKLGERLFTPELVKAFLELHIEQGPILVERRDPIAAVTSIRGNVRLSMRCRGRADHSGTTPLYLRSDAVLAAAAAVTNIERVCSVAVAGRDLIGTCGVFNTSASASASKVADQVDFSVEFRSNREEDLAWALELYRKDLANFAEVHRVEFEILRQASSAPVDLVHGIHGVTFESVRRAVAETTMRSQPMPSGAGHDAAVFAGAGIPTGMIFVRNQNGSHNPAEAMGNADFILGCDALERAVRRIANI